MKITKKVRLHVPSSLIHQFHQHAGAARFAYNWALKNDIDMKVNESDARKTFTLFKKQQGNEWTNEVNNNVLKQGIRDYYIAKNKYFKKLSNKPTLKYKNKCIESFYIDTEAIKIYSSNELYIPSIGKINYSGYKLPKFNRYVEDKIIKYKGIKPVNPRVTFDGIYWSLSVSYDIKEIINELNDVSIGVDLGLKEFATIVLNNNNKHTVKVFKSLKDKYKQISLRKKRLDKKISKRLLENKKKGDVTKSQNFKKLFKKRLKLTQKITNIQKDNIYQCVSYMVKSKPKRIVIEDLNIKGMMKNKKLAKWITFNQFYNL